MIANGIVTLTAVALSAHAVYQYQNDPYWWMYMPAYGLAGVVCIMPAPSLWLWRFLSSVAVVGGAALMLFLAWTFHSAEDAGGLELREARNLLPIAIGVALASSTRLMTDTRTTLMSYPRHLILMLTVASSLLTVVYSIKYYVQ